MEINGTTRRGFLAAASSTLLAASREPVIDIHQHTNYSGRTDEELIAHQHRMGITKTVLLPAGSKYGLAVGAGGNETVVALARRLPREFVFFSNELPDIPETRPVIEKWLKAGGIGIGEQKFHVPCDAPCVDLLAEIAAEYKVPILLHFEHEVYNLGFENFHKTLDRHPKVNFIGHAQTWWANVGKLTAQTASYPKGKVIPGGITDRLLSDYPNMYGDMSAGSGLNAMLRDEDHARGFLERHQDKLLYGSDCNDREGHGEKCSGAQQLAAIRRLSPSPRIVRKILYENAARLMKIA